MSNFFRPHQYSLMISPGLTHAWINVPKNASSFCQKVFSGNGWTKCYTDDLVDGMLSCHTIKKIIVLRDPVERWVSGFTQAMYNNGTTNIDMMLASDDCLKIIAMNPVFDDHTEHQARFIGPVATNVQYIKMQDRTIGSDGQISDPNKFFRELAEYVTSTGGVSNFHRWDKPIHAAEDNKTKLILYRKIRQTVIDNPAFKQSLMRTYAADYELLTKLKRFTTDVTATH